MAGTWASNFRIKRERAQSSLTANKTRKLNDRSCFASWDLDEASDSVPGALVLGITDLDLNQFLQKRCKKQPRRECLFMYREI